ncbi:leucine-rich repeat-containing protein 27-like [Periophthalmus magnuspinnatus]|uniref:leucine-rich repeat-containing protein 27-like n=1 Tax=Periophthalmus magnuspinnatus TaxID=409849 RepID=UPI002436A317|nr:leucine-rich repeat-containing protein 27-like [Periophthalmus magnuspinnatus]
MGFGVDDEEEGAAEEEELRRFRELKLQMSLMEKAELERAAKPPKPHTLPALRKKATRAGVTPLQLDAPVRTRSEERRQAALRELREKEAMLEQRRKSQEALRKWWTQAKTPQQGGHRQKKAGRRRQKEEGEPDTRPGAENSDLDQHQAYATIEYEESRAVQNLQQKIYAIVQRMEERRRDPTALNADLIWEAELDIKKMRSLQAELFDIKRRRVFGLYSAHARQKDT